MAVSLPYLASNKNVQALFDKIAAARTPDKFTQALLSQTFGLKGTNDRQLIPLLRNLGFIDQANTPTPEFNLLKGGQPGVAIAEGMRKAYGPLFDANQQANKLPPASLKSLISQVAGADADAAQRIAATFTALAKLGDFEAETPAAEPRPIADQASTDAPEPSPTRRAGLRPEFHYNIQIHLPANGNEETYLNIFNAIRKTFQ